jgi:omega-6 fatty acid desaturase (delta-12 desaturase)
MNFRISGVGRKRHQRVGSITVTTRVLGSENLTFHDVTLIHRREALLQHEKRFMRRADRSPTDRRNLFSRRGYGPRVANLGLFSSAQRAIDRIRELTDDSPPLNSLDPLHSCVRHRPSVCESVRSHSASMRVPTPKKRMTVFPTAVFDPPAIVRLPQDATLLRSFDSEQVALAARPFACEQRWRSWWNLWSTVALLVGLMVLLCREIPWLIRLPFSLVAGLTIVRLFVLYHDHQHGAILKGSKVADAVMLAFGLATLNPPSVWKRSHDHHHGNNCKNFGTNVGSYPLMTVEAYENASAWQRFRYTAARHPLTMVLGYATIFFFGMCVAPLIANPKRHLDAALSLACHGGLLFWLATGNIENMWLAGIIPCAISSAVGAYLFFAQHNFPGARLRPGREWDYIFAALNSSSYIRMGRLMRWFTGNIGYHHVHHLNSKIPFYRLPEAMAAIEDLQAPVTTSLRPRDVLACLRLKLWDPVTEQHVPWKHLPHPPSERSRAAV